MALFLAGLLYLYFVYMSFSSGDNFVAIAMIVIPLVIWYFTDKNRIDNKVQEDVYTHNMKNVLKNNSLKDKVIKYSNENVPSKISIYCDRVEFSDGNKIIYSDENYTEIAPIDCKLLAEVIIKDLTHKDLYSIGKITTLLGGKKENTFNGIVRTYDGSYVGSVSTNEPTEYVIGYEISSYELAQKYNPYIKGDVVTRQDKFDSWNK